jgi:hypothetical protein
MAGLVPANRVVIASEAKQSRIAAGDCFGVLRTPRNDGW